METTTDLYKVQVEYRSPALGESPPKLQTVTRYAAVHTELYDIGGGAVGAAAVLVLGSVLGKQQDWEQFQPVVTGVERVGTVVVVHTDLFEESKGAT